MFVCSFKASTFKLITALFVCAAVLTLTVFLMPDAGTSVNVNKIVNEKINLTGITSEKKVQEFFAGAGFEVEQTPVQSGKVKIPKRFDSVMEKYNDLQKAQGLDLTKYKGKTAHRYTYKVTALPDGTNFGENIYYATVVVHNKKVIAADVCCPENKEYYPVIINSL